GCSNAFNSEYWDSIVATNAWTPLGPNPHNDPLPQTLTHDGSRNLVPGHSYCVRVRAFTDMGYDQNHILQDVVGDWSYIDNGNDPLGNDKVAFTFSGYPDDTSCSSGDPTGCFADHVNASDYSGSPMFGETTDHTPVFTWSATPKAQGYFVVVARDPSFSNIIDY